MSESKYQPPVNAPENVPNRPESVMCVFFPTTQHVACTMDQLMLHQIGEGQIALGYMADGKFLPITLFPGTLVTQKVIEVP